MKYKLNNNGLAQGCAIPLKCEPLSLTGAAILGGAELLGSIFGGLFSSSSQNKTFRQQKELMKYNQELGFENMRYQKKLGLDTFEKTFSQEASLNASLMRNSPTIQKEAMINAGINPASQFGNFSGNLAQSSVPTYTPQSGAPSAPAMPQNGMFNLGDSISKIADLLVQTPLIKAKTRDLNADAEDKERKNRGNAEEDAIYSLLQNFTEPVVEDGKLIFKYKNEDGREDTLTEGIKLNTSTRKGVEATQNAWSRLMKENAENLADISSAELRKKLDEKKLSSNAWIDAVLGTDIMTYHKIIKEVSLLSQNIKLAKLQISYDNVRNQIQLTDKEFKELELKIRKETNLVTMTEKLLGGKFGLKEMIIGAFTLLMAAK